MVLLGNVCQAEACFGPSRDSVSLRAREVHGLHRTTIDLEIILAAPDGTPRDEGQIKAHFSPFRDSVNLRAR